jgi:hypothetical protein
VRDLVAVWADPPSSGCISVDPDKRQLAVATWWLYPGRSTQSQTRCIAQGAADRCRSCKLVSSLHVGRCDVLVLEAPPTLCFVLLSADAPHTSGRIRGAAVHAFACVQIERALCCVVQCFTMVLWGLALSCLSQQNVAFFGVDAREGGSSVVLLTHYAVLGCCTHHGHVHPFPEL